MKIGGKIVAGFLTVILMMAISGGISYYLLGKITAETHELQTVKLPLLEHSFQVAINSGLKMAAARGYVITGNTTFLNDYAEIDKQDQEILRDQEAASKTAKGKQAIQDVKKLDAAYTKIFYDKVIPLRKEGKTEEAIRLMAAETTPVAIEARKKMAEYIKLRVDQMDDSFETAEDHARQTQMTVTVSLIVALLIGTSIAWLITRMVTGPLNAATAHLGVMAGGDYTKNVDPRFLQRKDEFGVMAGAFDKLTLSMRGIVGHISQSASQVAASSEELTASAQQSADAANNVAQSIQQVASGSEKQMQTVNDTSAVVQEISATLEEVAATAAEMSEMAGKTTKITQAGQGSVDQAVSQMAEVGREAQGAQKAAEALKAGSQQIGEIVNLISSIAGQTNLLALNAAIEAARAGEAGRGFAVVAEEVRKLAEQSDEAARKITDLIGKNNVSISNVVDTIDTAIHAVGQGVELVNVAGKNFAEIGSQVDSLARQVAIIAKSINEAANGSQKIVASIRDVEGVSRDAAAEAQNVSAATEEQSASMEQIASSSQALAKLAEELQSSVAVFKI